MLPRVLINNRIVNDQLIARSLEIESVITKRIDTARLTLRGKPKIGHALRFDGDGDYVSIPDSESLRPSKYITVLVWAKKLGGTLGGFVSKLEGGYTDNFMVRLDTGKPQFLIFNSSGTGVHATSPDTMPDNEWTFIAAVYDGSAAKLYVNNVLKDSKSLTGDIGWQTHAIYIGRHGTPPWNQDFNGIIDEVRIYNRPLDETELTYEYNNGLGRHQPYSTQGLVGWWSFDEGSGTTAKDESGYGNDGTIYNAKFVPGYINRDVVEKKDEILITDVLENALRFDGVDDYVDFGTDSSLKPTSIVTIEIWVKLLASTSNGILIDNDGGTGKGRYIIRILNNVPRLGLAGIDGETYLLATTNINDGKWHHVVAVKDGTNVYIYVDGVQENSGADNSGTFSWGTGYGLKIGCRSYPGLYVNCIVAEARLYERALSAAEVSHNYNNGKGRPTPYDDTGLIGWFAFNEGSGSTVRDHSQYGNHGTINGATWSNKRYFAGFVSSVKKDVSGLDVLHKCSCQDYTILLDTVLVNEVYENKTDKEIIQDAFGTYLPEIDTSTYVADGKTHSRITFSRVTLRQMLDTLSKESGLDWYVDYEKKLHYFTKETNLAPFDLSDSPDMSTSYPYSNFQLERRASQLANLVTVEGGYYRSDDTDFELAGNGQTTELLLPYKLHAPSGQSGILVYRNDGTDASPIWTQLTVGIDNIDDLSSKDVLYNFQEKLLKFASAPPNLKRAIKVTGQYEVPILVRVRSQASYDKYGRWFEAKITNRDIDSRDWARDEGKAFLAKHAFHKEYGRLTCLEDGLVAGQRVRIINSLREVDDNYLIHRVTARLLGGTQWQYNVEFGEYNPDLVDMLIALKRKAVQQYTKRDEEVLNELFEQAETLSLAESTDFHSNATPASVWIALPPEQSVGHHVNHEELALAETPSISSHATQSYNWDDPDAKWDFATWG